MTAKILNFGSINIDHVYRVPRFVRPGETLSSSELVTGLGGKGANQSVALAKAGVEVKHVGRISKSDQWAADLMRSLGVNVDHVQTVNAPSGHAIIQVDENGENAILLYGGANQTFESKELEQLIGENKAADFLLMQNECNQLSYAFKLARDCNLNVALNPAPMTTNIKALPLGLLDTLIVNQLEAQALTNKSQLNEVIKELKEMLPNTRVALTLGARGAVLLTKTNVVEVPATLVEVIDTTGAGDTFVGYFLAGLVNKMSEVDALHRACQAAALAVTRAGAISSIPDLSDLTQS